MAKKVLKSKEVLRAFNKLREERKRPLISGEEFDRLLTVDIGTLQFGQTLCPYEDVFDGPLIKHFRDD